MEKKPDIVFSSMIRFNIVVAVVSILFPQKTKLFVRETSVISRSNLSFGEKILYRLFIKKYDRLLTQSDDMFNDIVSVYKYPLNKIYKINNPVNFEYIEKLRLQAMDNTQYEDTKILISIGRLSKQKNYEALIKTFSKINNLEEYTLLILGKGPDQQKLEDLINDLGLNERVKLMGFVENPYKFLNIAYAYICSSIYEGFPNGVLEALACGVPVVSNEFEGGINEIISDKNGFIIDIASVDLLNKSLDAVGSLSRKDIRENCYSRWDSKKILKEYACFFES